MSRRRRWAMFIVAMVEAMLWSGNIFGWASLVHVLKLQGVYSNLCPLDPTHDAYTTDLNVTTPAGLNATSSLIHNKTGFVCPPQDDRMALLYTVACVVYATPGIVIGYALHHFGLAFTRVTGGLMVSCGFVLLSFTSQATPNYLWGATLLLAIGGNTIRMSGLQYGNLFPEHRNTAMAIISGVFTPSAGIMMLVQTMYEGGMAWHKICWVFAMASFMVVALTPLMPRHHIPMSLEPENHGCQDNQVEKRQSSLKMSIFSVSSMLHAYWIFINMLGVTLFNTHFNTWINKFSQTEEEG
ncbi:Solute carrier family 43 member 3 [Chionoecetes opilio]|uniref:Solute carrier family 43 member 3 n=1 Tax=Chionoecetes opilio TaxID=41210 RepID=A0A8J5D3G7_CHIOP|nr:Solute carrier family 43 member 3 [Chionoecetes opilio]